MFIRPDWPVPAHIKAVSTTREGGSSLPPYQGLNLGAHVGDQPELVASNREDLRQALGLPQAPVWLNQIHSTQVLTLTEPTPVLSDADGSYTQASGLACTVMTADCLPVLLCDQAGTQVAAVHAGWRGLADGILEAALAKFTVSGEAVLAWLGPAIGPSVFEVGGEVRAQFMAVMPEAEAAFQPHGEKWLADLYQLARQRLARAGVHQIFGGDQCTYSQPQQYFSYRRDGVTGRQASLIWIEPS